VSGVSIVAARSVVPVGSEILGQVRQ